MLNSHWNIVSNHIFHVKCVFNADSNREGFRHVWNLSAGAGVTKRPLESWLTRPSIQICTRSLTNVPGRPKEKKKPEENSRDHLETLQKAKSASWVWFWPWDVAITPPWHAAAQELVTPGAPSLPSGPPAYRLGAGECWCHQPWSHKVCLFFWLMPWTWPWATSPLQHEGASICPSLPYDNGGPGDALRHGRP